MTTGSVAPPEAPVACSVRELALYFVGLGATGFGGPAALVGKMHSDLVEKRRWITERDYEEGLALAQLAPGPLAAQLAIYLGWVRGKVAGRRSSLVAPWRVKKLPEPVVIAVAAVARNVITRVKGA